MKCSVCQSDLPSSAVFCPRCGSPCAGAAEAADYRYAAFISYRHIPRDAEVAKRVQRFIETFRLPRGIAQVSFLERSSNTEVDHREQKCLGKEDAAPRQYADTNCDVSNQYACPEPNVNHRNFAPSLWPVPGKPLGKCFRDQDELAASHSLPESLRTALAQSRSLVVICSPAACESPWIAREVEMFAALHGRERIVCVLADGNSADSIPPLLRFRMLPDSAGIMRETPASPLAADLRPNAKSPKKVELLRIAAAIADIDYDSLRRRERARRRKRLAVGALSVAAAIALVATLGLQAHNTNQNALIEQSKSLAAEALAQYSQGEHLQAIETALSALPSSESDSSRPLVPEAQAALEKVLALNPDPAQPWIPLYCVDVAAPIVDFAYSLDGEWLSVLDETGTVSFFDPYTSQPIGSCTPSVFELREDANPGRDWFVEAMGPDALVAANRTGAGGVVCINPTTGQERWSFENLYALAAVPADQPDVACLLCWSNKSLACTLLDPQTGALVSGLEHTVGQFPQSANLDALCVDDETGVAYAGLGNTLYQFDFPNDVCETIESPRTIQSVESHQDVVVVAEADFTAPDADTNQVPFAIRAFKTTGTPVQQLWSHAGTYSFTVDGGANGPLPINGIPTIRAIVSTDKTAVIATAGKTLYALNFNDGELLMQHDFAATIVGATPCFVQDDRFAVAVALSDGSLNIVSPDMEITFNSSDSTTRIPYALNFASIAEYDDGNPLAFVHPADNPNRLLCYLFHPYYGDEPESFTLDELIAFGRSALDFS